MKQIAFRPLRESDLDILRSWLQRPHVKSAWPCPDTLAELREEYLPDNNHGAARPFVVSLDGDPTAFIQYYVVSQGGEDWWPDQPPRGAVGLDLFLANQSQIGQGLGTAIVTKFVDQLLSDAKVSQIRVDPRPDNTAAVRCFSKAGFQMSCRFTSPDGPAVLMTLDRHSTSDIERRTSK